MSIDIGKKVKDLRSTKKMTLKDLSEATGLSTGFLSQLERGLTAVATDSLEKIGGALGVDVSYFFMRPACNRNYIMRSYEREVFEIVSSQIINYHLGNDLGNKKLFPRLIDLLPINSEEDISQYAHDGEEFVYVLEGTLTLFINDRHYELFPGDTAHYSSGVVHNWANYTNKMVRLLVVSYPNPFREEASAAEQD